jgi:hypothetical protein
LAAVEVMVKYCAKKPGFYEVCAATLQHGTPGASIFRFALAHKSAAPIVRSCGDRKPLFARSKPSRIGACHPRGIDFSNAQWSVVSGQ